MNAADYWNFFVETGVTPISWYATSVITITKSAFGGTVMKKIDSEEQIQFMPLGM